MNILIIDGDRNISSLLNEQLIKNNINTKVANNGVEAYKILYSILPRYQFDFIITCIALPDENGLEIIKFVKTIFDSKIIVFTSKEEFELSNCQCDYLFNKNRDSIQDIVDVILNTLK